MTTPFERDVRAARARAAAAIARAEASAVRSRRFERLAQEGSSMLGDLNTQLAATERANEERHLASARMHQAWADRLERFARRGDPAEPPTLAAAVADCVGVRSLAITVWNLEGAVATLVGTDDLARRAQDLEIVTGEGPAYATATSHRAVRAPTEVLESRWPEYASLAADLGVCRVSAVPLGLGAGLLGSLTVFDPAYTEQVIDVQPLQSAADAFVDGVMADVDEGPGVGLRGLLGGDRAYLLHNAAGRVSVDERCDLASALAMIRARAFSDGTSAVDLSRRILDEGLRLGEDGEGV